LCHAGRDAVTTLVVRYRSESAQEVRALNARRHNNIDHDSARGVRG
jgi:hypothetical protein